MCAVELVADRETKAAFPAETRTILRVKAELEARGVFTRNVRDILCFAPPLVITEAQVDRLVEAVRGAITAVLPDRA
jgi:4-aminobutyrate--pyruvate transaminase